MDFLIEKSIHPFQHLKIYKSKSSSNLSFLSGELRSDFENPHVGQLINLQLRVPISISKSELDHHLDVQGSSMGWSSPHNPERGVYVVYKIKPSSSELRVGFSDTTETAVTSISIDTFER